MGFEASWSSLPLDLSVPQLKWPHAWVLGETEFSAGTLGLLLLLEVRRPVGEAPACYSGKKYSLEPFL